VFMVASPCCQISLLTFAWKLICVPR
jgi:hypothetical protein